MAVLIIEDDPKVQLFLKETLQSEFAPVFSFDEFPEDEDLSRLGERPQAIILDRLLGDFDTKAKLPHLRKKFPDTSIIVLSAINNATERAELLDLGADDYMGKPFSIVELKSRIRAVVRRSTKVQQTHYINLNSTILDINQRSLSFGETKVGLSAKEYELFYILAKETGRVHTKFELQDKVWQANLDIESNVLEVTIMNLRKKLQELKSSVTICSKRNIGYWIEI